MFITHGGLGGTAEATYFGVPLIGIPFLSDQFSNVATAVENGYAVMVDSQPITEETLSNALEEIITNPKSVVFTIVLEEVHLKNIIISDIWRR